MTPISTSKLCPHIQTEGSGWLDWLRGLPVKPKAVKVFSSGMAREVKSVDPAIVTVKRHWVQDQDPYMTPDGGQRFVDEQDDLTGTEFLEFLNETLINADTIRRCNDATLSFVTACVQRGVKPLGCSIPVGNPATMEDIGLYAQAAQAILDAGGALQYHSYFPSVWNHDWLWLAGRFEQLEGILRAHGVTGDIRWMFTECGFDGVNANIPSGAWRWLVNQGVLTIEGVQRTYREYAQRLDMYPGVVAAFVYTFYRETGGGDPWRYFEHADSEPMKAWFSSHWQQWQGGQTVQTATVNATAGLRVRKGMYATAPILGVLPYGSRVEVLMAADGWAQLALAAGGVILVKSTDTHPYGYCAAQYLDFHQAPA